MDETRKRRREAVERIYERAEQARTTIADVCKRCEMNPVTATRGRSTGDIGVKALGRLEAALTAIEAERASA